MATVNRNDTRQAIGATLLVFGALFLINKLVSFASLGLPWVMERDNLLLYAAVCFLLFKRDRTVGIILLAVWALMNISLLSSLLGTFSGFVLPAALLAIGAWMFFRSR